MGCISSTDNKIKKNLISYYNKCVKKNLLSYSFDSHVEDSFAKRIAKENEVTLLTAKKWIEFYKYFMVYVGWLFSDKITKGKPQPELKKYLILPYEILQVWREHVLYSQKYSEFSLLVSCNGNDYIPFIPAKNIWKNSKIENLLKFFRINRNIMTVFLNTKEVDMMFIFQSSYLKNLIHFNVKESDQNLCSLVKIYQREVSDPKGIFALKSRTLTSLSSLADKLLETISSCIKREDYTPQEWKLNENLERKVLIKAEDFQNIKFPNNFLQNYCNDHLLSFANAENFINEYKKFLYLAYVTNQVQCPSEEVDSVWHYHLTHVNAYLEFSSLKMERKMFAHNPNNGSEEDKSLYPNVYNQTLQNLQFYFGNVDTKAWPDRSTRLNESTKWINHQSMMLRCVLKKGKFHTNNKVNAGELMSGCSFGCGNIFGGPEVMGCGNLDEKGFGLEDEPNISGCTINTWCCGNCTSGCLGGEQGCGSQVTGVGAIYES
jgi:hypothetical protein